MSVAYNIDVIDVRNGNVIEKVKLDSPEYQIRYAIGSHGFYVVSAFTGPFRGQRIICYPKRFRKYAGVSERAVLGCTTVGYENMLHIGFVDPDTAA